MQQHNIQLFKLLYEFILTLQKPLTQSFIYLSNIISTVTAKALDGKCLIVKQIYFNMLYKTSLRLI